MPYRGLIEALYTLNSPPVVSFNRESFSIQGNFAVDQQCEC